MDFVGQRRAENVLMAIVIAFAAVSFVVGYAQKDFALMVKINGVGLALALLVVLPDWPFFNLNQWKWLPALVPEEKPAKK
ncbi:Signal peptidase complex subunit 1 [Tetrabaena socialis]|uniref:Signal peptidase complex subunit 1 n=1 Tax=Tetrabaena socialis TaxID=47790 RepID=A0A2J8A4Y7_9CHLO|nr:Signal peptidase complex subunit 1 [Tetrabaena socialis]|eukprot:PNH07576.1 Signal peptidase complex subunit 1 [Tetrabaena socialis]